MINDATSRRRRRTSARCRPASQGLPLRRRASACRRTAPFVGVGLRVQGGVCLDGGRLPLAVGELDVEVPDLAQAVTAQLQRVRQDADAVFADVEGVAPALEGPGVAGR